MARNAANNIVTRINKRLGDTRISGIYHNFRIPEFSNVKPGRENWIVRLLYAEDRYSDELSAEIADEMAQHPCPRLPGIVPDAGTSTTTVRKSPSIINNVRPSPKTGEGHAAKAFTAPDAPESDWQYRRAYNCRRARFLQAGMPVDASACDYFAACRLVELGYTRHEIIGAMLRVSPHIVTRHPNNREYANRTVSAAMQNTEEQNNDR